MNVVIVGAVACGAKAASRIRRLAPHAKIDVVDQGHFISFAACGLPYFVQGKVKEIDDLLRTTYGRTRDASYFRDTKDVTVHTGTRALAIDRANKTLLVRDLATGAERALPYDRLVLAPGASPVKPKIPGLDLAGVHSLTTIEDAQHVAELVASRERGRAVVIGAGFVGVETTEALATRRWSVTLVERFDQVFPWALDPEIAALVAERLFERAVDVKTSTDVSEIRGAEGRVTSVVTSKGEIPADLVIVATGVRPNVDLARDAGLALGETGAIVVDEHLRTSDPAIFAGGDAVEMKHLISGKPCFVPLGSTANKHGRVIGDNVCGIETRFPGILGTFVCQVFDSAVGSTGLSERRARDLGYDAWAVTVPGFDRAHYYPGAEIVALKLVVEAPTGRLLGMQALGKGEVARRIDVAATALSFGAHVEDLTHLDLAYAPPFATALDCLLQAANAASNRRAGFLHPITAAELQPRLQDDGVCIIDVRSPQEFGRSHIDSDVVLNVPIDELTRRFDELPRDRELVCVCELGLRSYVAQRLLAGAGFERVRTLDGGLFAWPYPDDLE